MYYCAVLGGLMLLYQDSHECVVDALLGGMIDGTGSMVKAEESTSEGWPQHNDRNSIKTQ